jgi:hypothetical protein
MGQPPWQELAHKQMSNQLLTNQTSPMKTLISPIALFLVAATLSMTACQQDDSNSVAPQTNQPATGITLNTPEFRVVQNFITAINNNDRAAAAPLLAPSAGYAYNLTGALNTGTTFQGWLESDLFGPRAVIRVETATQNANVVRVQGMWGRNGNANSRADYYFMVENGLITAWRLV